MPVGNTETTSLEITGLTPATTHRFVVIGRGTDGGTSPPSTPVDVTTTRGGPPGVPAFSFAGDQRLANGWSARWSRSGQAVTARNVGHNARIGPGEAVTIGFTGSGNATVPTTFTVDGAPA